MLKLAITFAIVLAGRAASAAECPATAVLEGDGPLVDSIDAQLSRRGVATSATANCPVAKARIERRGTAVTVIVTDPNGRRSERTLADPDAAAALIESWARQDMNAAALLGWTEAAPLVIEPQVDAKVIAPVAPIARVRDPLTVVAAGETSFGFNGTSWFGGRAGVCVRVGPMCAGASARVLTANPRRSFDVLVAAELPYAFGRRIVLLTGAGIGGGWFQAQRSVGEAVTTETTAGVRVDAYLSLSIAFTRYVSLHAGVSLGASPQAPVAYDGGDMPMTNGEPRGFFRGDLGLRIGAP